MNAITYDKTDKGREEIATRKYQMPPKLRTLLVLIDGQHPLDTLLVKFSSLGLTQASVDALVSDAYIAPVPGQAVAPVVAPVAARPPAQAARERLAARARAAQLNGPNSQLQIDAPEIVAETAPPAAAPTPPSVNADAERIVALHAFFNQTIKSTLGLRGIMMQLKVEKAGTLDELRALRRPYLEAVLKAMGKEMALSLRERLDSLLGGRTGVDDFILPGN